MTSPISSSSRLCNWLLCATLAAAHAALPAQDLRAAPATSGPASDTAPASDPLAGWTPDAKQKAVLASLPQDPQAQREELIRLAQIPLPTYEERRRFLDLMGDGFPRKHPLRQNEQVLLAYYRGLGKPTKAELDALVASLKQRMIYLKGGTFVMGDFGPMVFKNLTITDRSNNKAHKVALDNYSIMKGRVTFGELDLYLRDTGQPIIAGGIFPDMYAYKAYMRNSGQPIIASQDLEPVIFDAFNHRPGYMANPITWPQADGYCRWLAGVTGQPFKLPTEAQWEYAAREGGKLIAYPMYDFPDLVWQNPYMPDFQSVNESLQKVKARAGKTTFNELIKPRPTNYTGQNRIGMEGVVDGASPGEWASDWYDEDYYEVSPLKNPQGPATGTHKTARSGAYDVRYTVLDRAGLPPTSAGIYFRCVLDARAPWR